MKKRILLVEDSGYLSKQTKRFLEEDGFEVENRTRIDLAIEYVNRKSDEIDCIITDLNMEDRWLGNYRVESYGGILSGWIWLMRFVYNDEKNQNIPCIIYSGYTQELKNYLRERNGLHLLKKYRVSLIGKGGDGGTGYSALVKELKRLLNV